MKRTLCIRPLCRADYGRCKELMAQVHALHVQNRPDLFRAASPETLAAYYRAELAEGERLSAVAERDGVPVGACLVSVKTQAKGQTILAGRSIACVEALCVAQSCRGQGIGTSLMRWVAERAAALGLDSVELSVYAFNNSVRSLYEGLGFQVKSYHMEYLRNIKREERNEHDLL